ncbi:hypothetical protein AGDE_00261 [Angomonas deanei]|uniref:Serine protease n=1 Tax=Angomonas deanei TaxID=59799 RepID=S9X5B5_9TRYP|nr:hypothetical protein AGDE_11333 [Angomonas deanei]EPY37354.1 hypothetical protein AGDE_06580 [Angomonas deanei]EPY41082.1 hypothetical protein AGDE_02843 [Angomonas deanei]EPY43106.1 hypothetical protein AGDE_00817 [Angomonas deanei]EPY43660.1 hypothetical protein AGDE_00261 [Angomonas deanei]|eukprot:EPY26429.1 hypothetical protein AGDE_11333 [Angomonas deanei]
MIRHGLFDVPTNPKPSSSLLNSIYALYHKDVFLGSCFAIAPLVIVSAGHHYNTTKDDVGDFSILSGTSKWTKAEYGAKNPNHDMAVFWLVEPVPCFLPLRGHFPRTQSHVATIWLSLKPPHEHIISPGVVMNSNHETCLIKGTVSTTGSSGAPVVDFFGTHFVGIHLTSNTRDGSRVSGCLTARKMVSLLAEMGVTCRD